MKTKTNNTKHLNLPNPNKQQYAPPKPQNWEKNNTYTSLPNTPKNKPQKQ